jgi:hypothetical protein
MAPLSSKKRKVEQGIRGKTDRPKKRIRKQQEYHSSSDEDEQDEQKFTPVNLEDSDDENISDRELVTAPKRSQKSQPSRPKAHQNTADDSSSEDEDDSDDGGVTERRRKTSKRNDPEAFSTSISKILSTKLSQSARKDPVLIRSKEAVEASTALANERLEKRAKAKLRADRKEEFEKGRVKDVLGLTSGQAGEIAEEEKRLRKIAQRGVVKLFNAVRAAQVKAEQTAKEELKKGTVGMANREEKVNEMSKQGFLDLIGGKKAKTSTPVS